MASKSTTRPRGRGRSPGPAVDAFGAIAVDPTANVIALVKAGEKRADDLRLSEIRHRTEIDAIRADYDAKLRVAESSRIDAIRAVDVGAVNRAAEVSAAQALTLATQVATSAETLRTQVAAAAQASTVALAAALEPIQKDIADLRRVQYEQQGQKSAVIESKSTTDVNRNLLIGLLGVVGVAVVAIAPHIH